MITLKIDKAALDIMALNQVDMRAEVSESLTACEQAVQAAEAKLELIHARLLLRANKEPGLFGLVGKPTDALIKAAVIADDEYQAAQAELLECKHALKSWKGVDAALDDRRRMLEALVSLHGRDYWADVRMTGAERAAVADTRVADASLIRRRKP